MNFTDYLQFLEPLQDQLNRVYSVASLVLSVLIALWLFNFLTGLIQRTFGIGKAFGRLYRNYFHRYLRALIISLFSIASRPESNN